MPAGRVEERKMPTLLLGGGGKKSVKKKKGRETCLSTNPLVPERMSTSEREELVPECIGARSPARKA